MSLVAYAESGDESDSSTSSNELKNSVVSKKRKNQPVQILAPSLDKFKDFEDDIEERPQIKRGKLDTSLKGSGLLNLLPPCRKSATSKANTSLVPHTLTKKPLPTSLPSTSKSSTVKLIPKNIPKLPIEDSDDEDDESESFFSFESSTPLATTDVDISELIKAPATFSNDSYTPEVEEKKEPLKHFFEDKKVSYELQPDELEKDVLMKLQGKAQLGKEKVKLIDVHGDTQRTNYNQWFTKQLTVEKEPKKKGKKSDQPSSTHRKKNQITYLAFQAKEREIELKNMWSANRSTRRQTQQKYGF